MLKSTHLEELYEAFNRHIFHSDGPSLHKTQPDALWIIADILEKKDAFLRQSFSVNKNFAPTKEDALQLLRIENIQSSVDNHLFI